MSAFLLVKFCDICRKSFLPTYGWFFAYTVTYTCIILHIHVYIWPLVSPRSIVPPGTLYCIKYLLAVALYKCETKTFNRPFSCKVKGIH